MWSLLVVIMLPDLHLFVFFQIPSFYVFLLILAGPIIANVIAFKAGWTRIETKKVEFENA